MVAPSLFIAGLLFYLCAIDKARESLHKRMHARATRRGLDNQRDYCDRVKRTYGVSWPIYDTTPFDARVPSLLVLDAACEQSHEGK
jgi:hypothetical protein